ncbi:glycosyltransferase [Cohnella sp.]|uniref:glycosyltransferase n=1 Tax=Cohnella sp. TaxID=1883426 RepID=UPI0035699D45
MNRNKICFITSVQDPSIYQETIAYIRALDVPKGFEVETVYVQEAADGISVAYQHAMEHSDAKYKIYVRSNVYLVNRNLLIELIDLFRNHLQLGLAGIAGASYVPLSLSWEDAKERAGIYFGNSPSQSMAEVRLGEDEQPYQPMAILSDTFLATQYDVKWDTDFSGEHFLGALHALQFRKEGYQVGVPRQSKPWCLVDKDERLDGSEQEALERKLFLQAYSHLVFPKVSILIPTYNRPEWLELALNSAINQTYRHLEIIVCDDSMNEETERMIQPYLEVDSRIRYVKNERNLGQFENDLKLYSLASGEYINYLMDDDLFHNQKIELMIGYMLNDRDEAVSLVTSRRGLIDAVGRPIQEETFDRPVFQKDTRISGIEIGNVVLRYNWNFIGEPTTPLFRKKALKVPFGTFAGRKYGCNVDTATWLSLLQNSDAIYMVSVLSFFRIHGEQQLQSAKMKLLGAADYAHEILNAPSCGFLSVPDDYRKALENCISYVSKVMAETDETDQQFADLIEEIKGSLLALTRTHHDLTPKVSILIPTYNRPELFEQALQSAINQSYPNIEIIVCDDSTNDETEERIKKVLPEHPQLRYHRNAKNLGQFENDLQLMRLASGEYINFLMDDDLLHPEKVSKMMNYFIQDPDITIATSHRQIIDGKGQKQPDIYSTLPLFNSDTIIDGIELGERILQEVSNKIGEPTTVLFKKTALKEEFGVFCGRKFGCNVDLASWLNLLAEGKLVYLSETLSSFRLHDQQQQQSVTYTLLGCSDFAYQLIHAPSKGFFKGKDLAYYRAMENCQVYINIIIHAMNENVNVKELPEYIELLEYYEQLVLRKEEVIKKLPA